MNLNLSQLVLPVYHEFFNDQSYFSILYGGRGSGKSRAICQKLIYRILTEKNHTFVIIRDKITDHTNTTYAEFKAVIDQFQIHDVVDIRRSPLAILFPDFNSKIIFLGMDDPQRLKGLSGVTGLWFEEISEIKDQLGFEEVMAGFRPAIGATAYEQVILSFNPVSQEHWLKGRFFDSEHDKHRSYILKTTYLDNPFLNPSTVTSLLNLRYLDESKYMVNVLGEWGNIQSGAEFYKMFKYGMHVDSSGYCFYNPSLPLHISMDFNVLPHMTMIVAQVIGKNVRIIDEITGAHPHNTIVGICNLFRQRYPDHDAGLYVYGDPSVNHRSYQSLNVMSSFQVIANELDQYFPILRFPRVAPRVALRAQWINLILQCQLDGISILISPKCRGLIRDMMELQEDHNGLKLKEMMRTRTGSFEKYGHFSDALDYFMTECFKMDWSKFGRRGGNGDSGFFTTPRLGPTFRY